jgi:hypothetical protein
LCGCREDLGNAKNASERIAIESLKMFHRINKMSSLTFILLRKRTGEKEDILDAVRGEKGK